MLICRIWNNDFKLRTINLGLLEQVHRLCENGSPCQRSMSDQLTYTVDEANALLPWVIEQLRTATAALNDSQLLQAELDRLRNMARSNGHSDIDQQVSDIIDQAKTELEKMNSALGTLNEKQIVVRDLETQLIDFPGKLNSERIWLCWIKDEPEVAFWHDLNTGFAGRQLL